MSRKTYRLFLEDIIESMAKIQQYTHGMSYETFIANNMVVDAVIRNLEIIGEASKNIPADIQEKHPENLPETRSAIEAMLMTIF